MSADFGDPARAVLDILTRAATDRKSPWRWPVLATAALATDGGAGGYPGARILVVRAFERDDRVIELHTDRRSAKCAELRADPSCALLFFDKGSMIQLRVDGRATVHEGDDPIADAAFERARDGALDDYRGPPPGADLDDPSTEHSDDARTNFAAIRIRIERADLLSLSRDGHERRFADFTADPPLVRRVSP